MGCEFVQFWRTVKSGDLLCYLSFGWEKGGRKNDMRRGGGGRGIKQFLSNF